MYTRSLLCVYWNEEEYQWKQHKLFLFIYNFPNKQLTWRMQPLYNKDNALQNTVCSLGLWICEQALYYHYKRLTHTAASKIFVNDCLLLTMFKQPSIQALRYNFTIITIILCLSEATVMNRTKLRKR